MGGRKDNLDVSIIIVSWNTSQITCECIQSIYEQTSELAYEIVVVDNASSDHSVEMVKTNFPEVILIENADNRGFAAANNQGMVVAQGRYVLLLNSDTIVLDKAIEKVVDFADTHPEAAVVGCRVLNPDKLLQPTCFRYPSILYMILSTTYLYKIFPKNKFFGREGMTWWDRSDTREVDVVTGCFMLVRHEALEQVGMMDEQFFMYGEETDWCYRFKQAGWKVMFMPDAEIIHIGGQSSKKVATEMSLQLWGSILLFIKKHRPRWEYILACFLVWLFFVVRIPISFVRFLFSWHDRQYNWGRVKIYVIGAWRIIIGGGKALCVRAR